MNLPISEFSGVLVAAAAVLVALGVVWRTGSKVAKAVYLLETHWPVLSNIAEQFKKNGGNSLKDQIDRIEKMAEDAKTKAVEAHKTASKAHDQMIRVDENVRSLVRTITPAVVLKQEIKSELLKESATS